MEKGTTVGVDENTSQLPDEFELAQNYCAPGGTRTPNPWLRRPTTSSSLVIVFIVLKAYFIFLGCDLGAKVSTKSDIK